MPPARLGPATSRAEILSRIGDYVRRRGKLSAGEWVQLITVAACHLPIARSAGRFRATTFDIHNGELAVKTAWTPLR